MKIRNYILEILKINILSWHLNVTQASLHLTTENEDEIRSIANTAFSELGIDAFCKILTNNQELDSRKVKISRPSTSKIDVNQFRLSIGKYGKVDELYEIRGNSRKRSFIVAFSNIEEKKDFLKRNSILVGSNLFSIEDFHVGATPSTANGIAKNYIARISYIRNSNTEYTVKNLMEEMKATYWHIPISKAGVKLPVVIAKFANEIDMDHAKNTLWMFEGRRIRVTDINENICYRCGNQSHTMKDCPLNPPKPNLSKTTVPTKELIVTKVLPNVNAYKAESEKLIKAYTIDKEKEIDVLRKEINELQNKFQILEKENQQIRQEISNNQAKTSQLFEEMMCRQLEFSKAQNTILERINTSEKTNENRHKEIIEFLQSFSFQNENSLRKNNDLTSKKMTLRTYNGNA